MRCVGSGGRPAADVVVLGVGMPMCGLFEWRWRGDMTRLSDFGGGYGYDAMARMGKIMSLVLVEECLFGC